MKKFLCIILIMTNTLILTSCAGLKSERDDSGENTSVSAASADSTASSSSGRESTKGDSSYSSSSESDSSSVSKKNSNINSSTDNTAEADSASKYSSFSTKQYYLQKLDNIEAGMSDLDSLRAGCNAEMKKAAGIEYKRWDDALNEIYSVLKGQLSSDKMKKLESDEVEWIKHKESQAQKSADGFKGGSAESLVYTSALADLTKERCYYLVNNYMS